MFRNTRSLVFLLAILSLIAGLQAQTITTGDVTGTVTDSSGAIVPGATVTLKNAATGDIRTAVSGADGSYRLTFVKPGTYTLSAVSAGLKSDSMANLVVAVGQVQTLGLVLKPVESKEVVMVTDSAPLLQTDNANIASSFSTKQIDLLPAPGGDITSVAFTVPGITMSTGGGYGNFSSHGLPSTSNLFTTNGIDNMDPYLNLNNSGASNLSLGANEIQEASVVQNAYSAQYGRQAGAQVNYITKSGSNEFHGNLQYNYNGNILNANDFFANSSGTPKGRAISNQYGAGGGGPIKKNKLFFYVNTEGLRYTLPSSGVVAIPSPEFQAFTLKNVTPAQAPFYQKAFALYNSAPGASRAVRITNGDGLLQDGAGALGCGGLADTPTGVGNGVFGQNVSCGSAYGFNVSNQNTEWLFTTRVDYNTSDRQKMFFRFKTDHGLQPSDTQPINPLFNSVSNQPDYEGQFNHTFIFSARAINNFVGSGSYYSAIFSPADLNASLAAFPVNLQFGDGGANGGAFGQLGITSSVFPQGRRVGQLQLIDDFSYTMGRHQLKVGLNYRYNRVADTGNQRLVSAGSYTIFDLSEFATGAFTSASGSSYVQRFTPFPVVHLHLYNAGFYFQDEWAVKPNLKLTLAMRFDRTGNPSCVDKCFSLLNSPFASIGHSVTTPYNQSITNGLEHAFYDIEPIVPQPRFGFSYSPSRFKNTVIRGGVGLFADLFPSFLAGSVFANTPNVFSATVRAANINSGGAGSGPAIATSSGNAFQSGFANGATLAQLQAAVAPITFVPPGMFSIPQQFAAPKFLEYSFEIQQQIGQKNVATISYVGNHGYDIYARNADANVSANPANYPNGFGGIPSVTPDPRFRVVTQINNAGWSNYNGLTVAFRRAFAYGFQGQFGYTWSHSLDTGSNAGLTLFYSGDSLTNQINPLNLRSLNYSNSDYDIRHNFVADFLWEIPFKSDHKLLNNVLGGWSIGDKLIARTGTPFSVYNTRIAGRLGVTASGTILSQVVGPVNTSCDRSSIDTPCFTTASFATTTGQTGFGNLPRNSFRGPGYFDMDTTIYKSFKMFERAKFTFGASFFNLLNHPNFASPGQNVGLGGAGGLGLITSTVIAPTSAYGAFQGSSVSGRVIVLTGKFSF